MLGSQQLEFACDELALWLALYTFMKMGVGFLQAETAVCGLGVLSSISYGMCPFFDALMFLFAPKVCIGRARISDGSYSSPSYLHSFLPTLCLQLINIINSRISILVVPVGAHSTSMFLWSRLTYWEMHFLFFCSVR